MRATYTPAARLLRPSDYIMALKGRRVGKGALFVLMTPRVSRKTNISQARLGLIVAKRFAPKAVTRNTIKRVIRESFRQRKHQLPPKDFVFRLHSPIGDVSLRQLKKLVRNEVNSLLDKVMVC